MISNICILANFLLIETSREALKRKQSESIEQPHNSQALNAFDCTSPKIPFNMPLNQGETNLLNQQSRNKANYCDIAHAQPSLDCNNAGNPEIDFETLDLKFPDEPWIQDIINMPELTPQEKAAYNNKLSMPTSIDSINASNVTCKLGNLNKPFVQWDSNDDSSIISNFDQLLEYLDKRDNLGNIPENEQDINNLNQYTQPSTSYSANAQFYIQNPTFESHYNNQDSYRNNNSIEVIDLTSNEKLGSSNSHQELVTANNIIEFLPRLCSSQNINWKSYLNHSFTISFMGIISQYLINRENFSKVFSSIYKKLDSYKTLEEKKASFLKLSENIFLYTSLRYIYFTKLRIAMYKADKNIKKIRNIHKVFKLGITYSTELCNLTVEELERILYEAFPYLDKSYTEIEIEMNDRKKILLDSLSTICEEGIELNLDKGLGVFFFLMMDFSIFFSRIFNFPEDLSFLKLFSNQECLFSLEELKFDTKIEIFRIFTNILNLVISCSSSPILDACLSDEVDVLTIQKSNFSVTRFILLFFMSFGFKDKCEMKLDAGATEIVFEKMKEEVKKNVDADSKQIGRSIPWAFQKFINEYKEFEIGKNMNKEISRDFLYNFSKAFCAFLETILAKL